MHSPAEWGAIVLGVLLIVNGILWRQLHLRRRRRDLRAGLDDPDPAMRAEAVERMTATGISEHATVLEELVKTERDPLVLEAVASAVFRHQWESAGDPAIVQLRMWASNRTEWTGGAALLEDTGGSPTFADAALPVGDPVAVAEPSVPAEVPGPADTSPATEEAVPAPLDGTSPWPIMSPPATVSEGVVAPEPEPRTEAPSEPVFDAPIGAAWASPVPGEATGESVTETRPPAPEEPLVWEPLPMEQPVPTAEWMEEARVAEMPPEPIEEQPVPVAERIDEARPTEVAARPVEEQPVPSEPVRTGARDDRVSAFPGPGTLFRTPPPPSGLAEIPPASPELLAASRPVVESVAQALGTRVRSLRITTLEGAVTAQWPR